MLYPGIELLGCGIAANGSCGAGTYWPCVDRFERQRLYYVMSSRAVFADGGREYPILPGRVYLFPRNLEFVVRQESAELMQLVYFDFRTTPPIISDKPIWTEVKAGSFLHSMLEAAASLFCEYGNWPYKSRDVGPDLPHQHMIRAAFDTILTHMTNLAHIEYYRCPQIQQSVDYIHEHYHEPLSVNDLAEAVYLCKDHYIRKFRRYMCATPYQYILSLRMNEARRLLLGGASYEEAAQAAGFESGSALRRLIRQQEMRMH